MYNQNILEKLYYGEFDFSTCPTVNNQKYSKLMNTISESEKKLLDFFNKNSITEKDLFLEMVNNQSEVSGFCELQRFVDGFKLGAKFMMDIF